MAQTTKTIDERREEIKATALDEIIDRLEEMSAEDFAEVASDYGDTLYNSLEELFDCENLTAYEAFEIGRDNGDSIDEYATYYRYEWGDILTYDDKDDAVNLYDLARDLFRDGYFDDILDEYNEKIEALEEEANEEQARREEYARAIKAFGASVTKAYRDADALQLAQITAFINETLYGTDEPTI